MSRAPWPAASAISSAPRASVSSSLRSTGGCWTIAIWTCLPAMERLCAVDLLRKALHISADARAEPVGGPHRRLPGGTGGGPGRVSTCLALVLTLLVVACGTVAPRASAVASKHASKNAGSLAQAPGPRPVDVAPGVTGPAPGAPLFS